MSLTKLIELKTGATSQVCLAALVGVRQSTVSAWQNGVCLPPSTRLPALAAALGMTLPDLTAMVTRERKARARRLGKKSAVVGRRHVRVPCPKRTPVAAPSRGRVAS